MLKIGLSFWGLCAQFEQHRCIGLDTPDGHRYGRSLLVDELISRGHEVSFMQLHRHKNHNGFAYSVQGTNIIDLSDKKDHRPDLDVLFLEWRWKTWKNDRKHADFVPEKYEPDFDRQDELINHYSERCPVIAWDTDHKITADDEKRYERMIIADPAFVPTQIIKKRESLPFWTDFKQLIPSNDPYPIYGYVGNRYEREDEFQRFYFSASKSLRSMGIQTSMYGNWLQVSPERQRPETAISVHRDVSFNHRMNFYDSMNIMNRFICTTHVSKDDYYRTGFVSPRYFEALAVNCPALVPSKHILAQKLNNKLLVDSTMDVIDAVKVLKTLNARQRADVVAEQREHVKQTKMFDVKFAADFIEEMSSGA